MANGNSPLRGRDDRSQPQHSPDRSFWAEAKAQPVRSPGLKWSACVVTAYESCGNVGAAIAAPVSVVPASGSLHGAYPVLNNINSLYTNSIIDGVGRWPA